MKKVIVLNGSPRNNCNTAQMLKEAQKAFCLGKKLIEM